MDLLICGGLVVTGTGIRQADIAIEGGKIVQVESGIDPARAKRTVDATHLLVFPGFIDAHVHPVYEDNLENISQVTAYGGITYQIHYAYIKPGQPMLDTIKWFRDTGLAHSMLDFSLHAGFFDAANQVPLIPQMFPLGLTSGKIFMAYAKLKWMTDDYWLTATADMLASEGGLLMVHAENGLANDYWEDKYLVKEGRLQQEVFLQTNPDILEAEAVHRAIRIAQVAGCPIYIVHNTAAASVEVIRRLKAEGRWVYAETCPHYLGLTEAVYQRFGALAKVGPPIRRESDRLALWQGLVDGTIDTIGSDHAAKAKKQDDDFFKAAYGSPECETMLEVVYDEGVNRGWISLPRLAQVMSENPAKIFGLWPKKGALQVNSDADLVLFDPQQAHTITHSSQHTRTGYTLFDGRECLGKPVFSLQRGRVLLDHGEIRQTPGSAQFLPTQAGKVDPTTLR